MADNYQQKPPFSKSLVLLFSYNCLYGFFFTDIKCQVHVTESYKYTSCLMNEMCVVKDHNSTVTSFIIHKNVVLRIQTHTTTNTLTFNIDL